MLRSYSSEALELTYKDAAGALGNQLLYRENEASIEIVGAGRPWSFDGDGSLFRLVAEAQRIRLAHLFDPVLAVHTSLVDPLPHQMTAVYGEMLPRQPLRYLLADDPGAGKTIMTGLFIKELVARADLQRCLVVCPGSLAEQWQDELYRRFHLPFEILTNPFVGRLSCHLQVRANAVKSRPLKEIGFGTLELANRHKSRANLQRARGIAPMA